tara:strand:- start:53 stop:1738 length:1686 start_codon:yes stop_codon:yes gene_type:complete
MATYKKRAGTNLTASINVNYDGKEIIKNLQREYQESSVLKKTISAVDVGVQIINFDTDSSFPAGSFKDCKFLLLCNEGDVTAELYYYMTEWSHASPDTVGNDGQKIHFLLHPNEYIILPNLSYIDFGTIANSAGNGATLDNAVPDANLYVDTGVNLDGALEDSETALQVADIAPFEVGDLVQVGINATTATRIEVMEVTSITIDDSGDDQDGAGTLVVTRALFGTSKADKDSQTDSTNGAVSGANVHFPIFNEYYDHDRRLHGSSQLVQTDGKGRWKSRNFFGKGRSLAANDAAQGLVQGSVAIKFYESAYQEISFGGTATNIMITGSTSSKLATSTTMAFNLTIDDSSAATISFTTDSSNVNFGGTNGVINKIQTAINTATQTTGNALYGMSCTVSIVNGRLRFTSNSHLAPHDGTNGSKILLEDAGSGTNLFSGSAGIFPDDAVINAPVEAKLPDDTIIDTNSGATYPNIDAFMYDNGQGKLIYQGNEVGTVVYKTGAIEWTIPSLPNAQFVINAAYDSAFSGGIKASTVNGKDNAIANIFGRSTNDKITTTIGAYVFS